MTLAATLADSFRVVFFVTAGLYFGVAVAVLRRYLASPPRSRLRRAHVGGVALGTSLLVVGAIGDVVARIGEPIVWYGAPIGFMGVAVITLALVSLYAAQGHRRPVGQRSTDYNPTTVKARDEVGGDRKAANRLAGLMLASIVGVPLLIGLAMLAGQQADDRQATDQAIRDALQRRRDDLVAGCERDQQRNRLSARAWREAEAARRADGDLDTAKVYADVADDLEDLAAINCSEAYPRRNIK